MNQNMGGMNGQHDMCHCPHHKVIPLAITLIGLVALLGATGTLSASTVGIAWPVLLIIIGLTKLSGRMCKCCK